MDKLSKQFLYTYLNNISPTGHEYSGQKIWLEYIKKYIDDYIVEGTAQDLKNSERSLV